MPSQTLIQVRVKPVVRYAGSQKYLLAFTSFLSELLKDILPRMMVKI